MLQTRAITLAQSAILLPLLIVVFVPGAAATDAGGQGVAERPALCAHAPVLDPGETIGSLLEPGEIDCYTVALRAGEYVTITVEGIGRSAGTELWLPNITGGTIGRGLGYGRGELRGSSQVITAVAAIDGTHWITVGPVLDGGPPLPYRIMVTELLTVERYRDRLERMKSDPRVEWLRDNAVAIRTVAPEDEDFSDLEPLKEILEGVDVVMLGEALHSDAPTFLANTRFVKFLHEEMDFDVLAFEDDLYSKWKMWNAIKEGESSRQLVRQWMYGNKSVREFQPLLDYVGARAGSDRPLELAGVDPHVGWRAEEFLEDLGHFLDGIGLDVTRERTYQSVRATLMEVFRFGDSAGAPGPIVRGAFLPANHPFGDAERSKFRKEVAELQEVIRSRRPGQREASFWTQVLGDTPNWLDIVATTQAEALCTGKDRHMATNLLWLLEKYFPGRKLIVWAHTGHLYRNPYTIRPPGGVDSGVMSRLFYYTQLDRCTVFGHDVHEALGDRVYALGVISYQGQERPGRRNPVEPINRDQVEELELEELFYLAGHEYAMVDFRSMGDDGAWLHHRLYARAAPHRALRARWPAVLDGFLFIRETYPTTYPTERLPPEVPDR